MTTWSATDKSAGITLTNGNLTATSGTGSTSVRSTTSKTTSDGKVYWELTVGTVSTDVALGIANSTESLSPGAGLGGDANGMGFYCVSPAQATFVNGSQLNVGSSASVNGEVVMFACNFATSPPTIWIKDSKMTGWNNSGTANPSTSTGGQSLTGLAAGPYFAMFNNLESGGVVTANFGGSAFTGTVPTGFSAWDAIPSETGTISATTRKPTANLTSGVPNETGAVAARTRKPSALLSGSFSVPSTGAPTVTWVD